MESTRLTRNDISVAKFQTEMTNLLETLDQVVQSISDAQDPAANARRGKLDIVAEPLQALAEAIARRECDVENQVKELRRNLPATYFRNNSRIKKVIDLLKSSIQENQNDSYALMDALQIQNETVQQLSHAVALLRQLERKLHEFVSGADRKSVV